MILTVNPNPALDRVMFIEEFHPSHVHYPQKVLDCVGGKGLDASVVLQALEAEQLALGFIAGEVGKQLAALLDRYGIPHDLTWVDGETRIAHVIVESARFRHSHITTPGFNVSPQDCDRFFKQFNRHIRNASWVVAAGSLSSGLPVDFYRQVAGLSIQAGSQVLIDATGEPARQAALSGLTILKMNRHEFNMTFNTHVKEMADFIPAVRKVMQQYRLPAMVITCGEEGILAVVPECAWLAKSPLQVEVNSAGAGDGVSAALAWRFSLGDSWEAALLWSAAVSAAVVLTEGTADCRREDVERLYPKASIQKIMSFAND